MNQTSSSPSQPASTMRRAVCEPLVGVRLEQAPVPTAGPGQVLLRSRLVGICGSDTHALSGDHPFLQSGYVPGHEATGVVVQAGEGVTGLTPGQRVLLKPNVACEDCDNCRAGRSNACEELAWVGCDTSGRWPGAMAEYVVAPERNLFVVPDGMAEQTAVLVECLATPVHAARLAGDLTGARVVVLGAGTIGVLCVVAALQAGAGAVVVTDRDQAKLDRAVGVGARGGVLADADDVEAQVHDRLGGRADVVFDCVAAPASLALGVALLRRAGTLLVVGVPAGPGPLPLPQVQDHEIRVQGCAAYTEVDVRTALQIATDGGLPTEAVVSDVLGLDEVAEAFTRATAGAGKVLVEVGPADPVEA